MADPLKLLREYIITNRPIKERDDYIIFGDIAFPKGAKTNHVVFSKDEYYTLESLYFFYKKRTLAHTAYVKDAAAKNIQVVTRPDRKGLEDYLTKEKLESNIKPNIDHNAPLPPSIHVSKLPSSTTATTSGDHHQADGQPDAKRARFENDKGKEKDRLRQMLDGGARAQGAAEDIRGLSEDLTKEKIAALRSKAMARKQKNIKNTDEDLDIASGQPGGISAAGLGIESRRYMDAGQTDLARELSSRERQWRTRTTCMEAASKNFAKSILPVLQTLKIREEGGRPQGSANAESSAVRGSTTSGMGADSASRMGAVSRVLAPHQQQGYNRYDQERFRKEETEGFKIDTMGTYHGVALKLITEGAKPKQVTPQLATSSSASAIDRIGDTANSNSAYDAETGNRPQKRVSRTPIIIIPGAGTSLITIYNARDLLQDLKYVSTEDKRAQGTRRENEILVQRQKDGNVTVPFRVIDNPLKLTPDEWDRVVAVFVQGPAWQFKGWPWHGNPVEIFEKVAAFHLKWDDVKLDANVAKWAVNVIQLSRNKRHLDRASLLKFWDTLSRHIMKHKPYLRH